MNIKKIGFQFLTLSIALAVALAISYVSAQWQGPTATPPGNNTPPPVNVGTVGQVKDGGLSVNTFIAYMNSAFRQHVSVSGGIGGANAAGTAPAPLVVSTDLQVNPLASTEAGNVCTDSTGKIIRCGAVSSTECLGVKSGSQYDYSTGSSLPASGVCPAQLEYYSPGTWVNPAYSGTNYQICTSSTTPWRTYTGGSITVTNRGIVARNYLVIGQAFVGNDSGVDAIAYMLKEGNPTSFTHTNVIGFDQTIIDYSRGLGRPAALQVMSVETIPAGGTKVFNGWVSEIAGGCGDVYGMKTTATPL